MPVEITSSAQIQKKMSDIATSARTGKKDLLTANHLSAFDLTGLVEIGTFGGRITFPGKVAQLAYSPEKLLVGLIAGDVSGEDSKLVQAYYPHEKQGVLTGVTVLTMTLEEAVALTRKCASQLQVPEEVLIHAIDGYSTGISFYGDIWKLHENDAAPFLSAGLQESSSSK